MIRLLAAIAMICSLGATVRAQDTAGSWTPTFTSRHMGWDVTCDAKTTGDLREERCYIRYIDAYSPRPNFGVLFMFIEIEGGIPAVSLGREFETDLVATTLRVRPGWTRPEGLCTGGACTVTGDTAVALIDAMRSGGVLETGFVDATGADQLRQWASDGFDAAFTDLKREAAARGL